MAATVQLVSGSGTTTTAAGYKLSKYPWVYIGGTVDTISVVGTTGTFSYYGLDNSSAEVIRIGCYKDITLAPQWEEFDDFCNGVRFTDKSLSTFQETLTVTDDIIDLAYLRRFLRQTSGNYHKAGNINIETLLVGDAVTAVVPVLFEHHYTVEGSTNSMYVGILGFEAELSLGDITMDYNEGYSAELTIDIRYSDTYSAFLSIVRFDSVNVTI